MPTFKKCPFCAEEIQLEAIKCKHCGSMLSEEQKNVLPTPPFSIVAPNSKLNKPLSTNAKIIFFLIVFGSLLFMMLSIDGPDLHKTPPATPQEIAQNDNDVKKLIKAGFILKSNPSLNEVYVDKRVWDSTTIDQKKGFGYLIGRYFGYKDGKTTYWATIKDYRSGKQLAKWSETFGLTVE